MRELKFRAWGAHHYSTGTARKYYVYFKLGDLDEEYLIRDGSYISEMCDDIPRPIIEQFTGLHDKNGKEIYEGDILDIRGEGVSKRKVIFEAPSYNIDNYDNGDYYDGDNPYCHPWERSIVIGNIHENPELLEVQT